MPEKKLPWEPESYEKYWSYLRKVAKRLVIEGLKLSEKQIADVTVSRTHRRYYGMPGTTNSSVTVSYSNCVKLVLRGEINRNINALRVRFNTWDKRVIDTMIEVAIPFTATKKEAIQLIEDSILASRL